MTRSKSHLTIERTDVDPDGHLRVFAAAHPDGLDVTVGSPVASQVARDLTAWLGRKVAANGHGGRLTSAATAFTYSKHLGYLHDFLLGRGITSFGDTALTYAVAREAAALRPEASFRSPAVRALVDCARRAGNPDRLLLHSKKALLRGRVESSSEEAYPPALCDSLERWARETFSQHVTDAKFALSELGLDTRDEALMALTADDVRDAARTTGGELGKAVLALANDAPITFNSAQAIGLSHDVRRRVNNHLSVPRSVLAAAHILLTLDKNEGHNDQPVKSLRPSDTAVRDNGVTVTELTKTRHGAAYKVVSNQRHMFSFGGVLTRLRWLTVLDRDRRLRRATTDLAVERAELLFQTVAGSQTNYLTFTRPSKRPPGLNTGNVSPRRLRKSALQRRILNGDDLHLAAASPAQVEVYFASSLPKAEVERITTANLDAMVATSSAYLDGTSVIQPGVHDDATDDELDRGVATCGTGGTDPESGDLCRRGLLGCFGCPAARITERNAAGLAAAVRATDHIRQYGPQEWASGPAPAIWSFSTAALTRLRTTPDETTIQAAMPVLLATYYEAR